MDWLNNLVLLFPSGAIALAERGLIFQATLFMLIVAVPVFGLIFFFAWWYRQGNTKAKYTPDWAHSNMEELIWWAIPLEIVLILGALTWGSTHELDPRRPLSNVPPVVIEAVALEDKWLFIYPEEKIATVNYLQIPAGRPVLFKITADAPMNSFWIPALGGQMYAMTGMVNELNLIADKEGTFAGGSANYSGAGFVKMKFMTDAVSPNDFDSWVGEMQTKSLMLGQTEYEKLARPSEDTAPTSYGTIDPNLFDSIVMKFMYVR